MLSTSSILPRDTYRQLFSVAQLASANFAVDFDAQIWLLSCICNANAV